MLSNTVQLFPNYLLSNFSEVRIYMLLSQHEASDSIQLSCGCKSPDIVHTHLLM